MVEPADTLVVVVEGAAIVVEWVVVLVGFVAVAVFVVGMGIGMGMVEHTMVVAVEAYIFSLFYTTNSSLVIHHVSSHLSSYMFYIVQGS